MENFFLSAIVREISPQLIGRSVSKIWLIGDELSIDFRPSDNRMVIVSIAPDSPAFYMGDSSRNRGGQNSQPSLPFISQFRKKIGGAKLINIEKEPLDRVIRMDFEKYDVGGDKSKVSLIIALTGRSSNLYIADKEGWIEENLKERGGFMVGDRLELGGNDMANFGAMEKRDIPDTEEEILKKYFGPRSPFSPLLKNEFIARTQKAAPVEAFESLITDLYQREPVPLIYSRVPLEEIGQRLINLKSDLLLSHIEMKQTKAMNRHELSSLSEAANLYYQARSRAKAFQDRFNSVKRALAGKIKKQESLKRALQADLARFEDPEKFKKYGDLLLANSATASVEGSVARVVDYYDPNQQIIEIEIGEGDSLQQAASQYFNRYQKARRAVDALTPRFKENNSQLESLYELARALEDDPTSARLDDVIKRADKTLQLKLESVGKETPGKSREKGGKQIGRWFKSSDGYEIGVGRNDRDNDALTFRLARPQDVWMHAADYPGSHVIIRNPRRDEIPHRTIIEASELAAFYSQARNLTKVAVHYTQKKFVSKPPRSKPGLVRLSSFKTALVQPGCDLEKID